MKVNLNLLSNYRVELMGASTILILLCHAYGNNVKMPYYLERIVDNAQIGVDLFLLLSGIGIAFSLSKTRLGAGITDIKSWSLSRLKRIYVPFSIIMGLFYLYAVLFENKSINAAFLSFTNIGWWINGDGAWYVSLSLLLYLLSPFLYKSLHNNKYRWTILVILCGAVMILFQDDEASKFHWVANALKRAPAFFIGMALAPLVKNGTKINLQILFIISLIIFFCAYKFIPMAFCKWMIVLPITLVLVLVIDKIKFLRAPLAFFGKISLESYLTNITLGHILNHKSWIICGLDLSYGHYLEYAVVLGLGVLLAYIFNRLSYRILNNI